MLHQHELKDVQHQLLSQPRHIQNCTFRSIGNRTVPDFSNIFLDPQPKLQTRFLFTSASLIFPEEMVN